MHNAEKPNPPASVRDTWGQGRLCASSNTRARNSLRAVAPHNAPSRGVHGEGGWSISLPSGRATPFWHPGNVGGPFRRGICHPPSAIRHLSSAIRHLSSAIRHLSSAISPSPFPVPNSAFRIFQRAEGATHFLARGKRGWPLSPPNDLRRRGRAGDVEVDRVE